MHTRYKKLTCPVPGSVLFIFASKTNIRSTSDLLRTDSAPGMKVEVSRGGRTNVLRVLFLEAVMKR